MRQRGIAIGQTAELFAKGGPAAAPSGVIGLGGGRRMRALPVLLEESQATGKCILFSAAGSSGQSGRIKTPCAGS